MYVFQVKDYNKINFDSDRVILNFFISKMAATNRPTTLNCYSFVVSNQFLINFTSKCMFLIQGLQYTNL